MASFMYVISMLLFLFGAITEISAKSSIHEIYGAVIWLISAIFWIGGAIVTAIDKNTATNIHLKNQETEFNSASK